MSDLTERIARLSPKARAVLERQLMERVLSLPEGTIQPRPDDGPAPLSFAQQRLWILDGLDPGKSIFNISSAFRIRGPLDVSALERAFDAILERHQILRSAILLEEDGPVQVVGPQCKKSLPIVDLTAVAETTREIEALRLAEEEVRAPFDLSLAPLLRSKLLRLAEQEHILLVTIHHVVFDAWSGEIFYRELSSLYEAFHGGRPSPLRPLPIQYADFALWQRQWLRGEVLDRQIAYWRQQLAGVVRLELPTDHQRPTAQSFRGGRGSIAPSGNLTERLKRLSQREGATLYMTLLAAFQALLLRYTGQDDIVVGSPIAGRNRGESEGLIGFFVNTLVLRTSLSGDPTFRQLLSRVCETCLQAYAHQDLPFEKLVEEMHPERDLGQTPLFQVLFALQNAPPSSFQLDGLEVVSLPLESRTARFDLEVYCWEKPNGLTCTFVYPTDLFEAATIARMMSHYQNILEDIATDADRRVSQVAMLTEAERRQVVEGWNQTRREYPLEKTVHRLFEEQVERTPEAVAVVFGRERVTYAQLNKRANQLASYLRKRGVGPEVLVGLCVGRSLAMVVALLGIMKAGGAYVPLDPFYPPKRLSLMLEDARARVVLTQASLVGNLPEGLYECVRLDADWMRIEQESAGNLQSWATSSDLAYVIYTSGSTGTPKGVAIEHRNTVSLLAWVGQQFSQVELSGVLASTSICFDLSVFELFAPLVWGGKVILAQDILELAQLPAAGEVKLINTVPSAMGGLLRLGDLPPTVETVNLAGEPLAASLVREILRRGKVLRVLDLYGPTEDTTYSICARRLGEGPVTIGRPIFNKRAYILDVNLSPVPVGVPGDLYVAGAGVARGYLNRPELTAERFLADPFRPGERMYKSGDRARFLPDGNIQFLGRRDHQAKIRGYRIEMGEIEEALARHPRIRACAVLARQEERGGTRLVGYVVAGDAASPSVTELRDFLRNSLPEYMVPSAFVFLDALPLLLNGKLDRQALPAPDTARPELEDVFVAPRNDVEETVANIWRQVLGLEKIGVHDNFFDLGGHSLLATRVFARLQKAFPVAPPLRALFEKVTVAELSAAIESLQSAEACVRSEPIAPGSRQAIAVASAIADLSKRLRS